MYNKDNILLAFYKGENGNPLMELFSLFGLPVKSMCILAGDHVLMLRGGNDNFQFSPNASVILDNPNYVIVDTKKKWTREFAIKMGKHAKKKADIFGLRVRCIEAVSDLLSEVDERWKPTHFYDNIPSVYLLKALGR